MPLDVLQGTGVVPVTVSSGVDVPLLTLPVNNSGNPVLAVWNLQHTIPSAAFLITTLYIDGVAVPVTERRTGDGRDSSLSAMWFASSVVTDVAIQVRRSGGGSDPTIDERSLVLVDTADGIPGPAGPAGPAGPTGPAGAAASGLSAILPVLLLMSLTGAGAGGSSHGSHGSSHGSHNPYGGPGFGTLGELLTAKIGPKLVARLPETVPLFLRLPPRG